jgi:hypothetical protein
MEAQDPLLQQHLMPYTDKVYNHDLTTIEKVSFVPK